MSNVEQRENEILHVISFLTESEYGTEDYYLSYKTLIKLLNVKIDECWERVSNEFINKQEYLYFDILDRLIDINDDDEEFSHKPEVVAKIIKADGDFIEYCKQQIDVENSCEFISKNKIQCKLTLIRKAIELC